MHFAYSIRSYSKNPIRPSLRKACVRPSESVVADCAEITVQRRAFTDFIAEMRTIFPSWEEPERTNLCKKLEFNHLLFGIFFISILA